MQNRLEETVNSSALEKMREAQPISMITEEEKKRLRVKANQMQEALKGESLGSRTNAEIEERAIGITMGINSINYRIEFIEEHFGDWLLKMYNIRHRELETMRDEKERLLKEYDKTKGVIGEFEWINIDDETIYKLGNIYKKVENINVNIKMVHREISKVCDRELGHEKDILERLEQCRPNARTIESLMSELHFERSKEKRDKLFRLINKEIEIIDWHESIIDALGQNRGKIELLENKKNILEEKINLATSMEHELVRLMRPRAINTSYSIEKLNFQIKEIEDEIRNELAERKNIINGNVSTRDKLGWPKKTVFDDIIEKPEESQNTKMTDIEAEIENIWRQYSKKYDEEAIWYSRSVEEQIKWIIRLKDISLEAANKVCDIRTRIEREKKEEERKLRSEEMMREIKAEFDLKRENINRIFNEIKECLDFALNQIERKERDTQEMREAMGEDTKEENSYPKSLEHPKEEEEEKFIGKRFLNAIKRLINTVGEREEEAQRTNDAMRERLSKYQETELQNFAYRDHLAQKEEKKEVVEKKEITNNEVGSDQKNEKPSTNPSYFFKLVGAVVSGLAPSKANKKEDPEKRWWKW